LTSLKPTIADVDEEQASVAVQAMNQKEEIEEATF
jgi:hypothetical protein